MKPRDVNWTNYASAYDLMAQNNPAYQELVEIVTCEVGKWNLAVQGTIIDIGAGTGNFSVPIAKMLPSVRLIHIDNDLGMLQAAERKAKSEHLSNMEFLQADASSLTFETGTIDAAVSVHALYTFPNPSAFLADLHRWLRPNSPMLLCDFGRPMNLVSWAFYLFRNMRKSVGMLNALTAFVRGRNIARQNKRIAVKQRNGEYWCHSSCEFRSAVELAGFSIREQRVCYRGYSDFAVCQKSDAGGGINSSLFTGRE